MGVSEHERDRELLTRARGGDAEAFGVFYRQRRGAVLALLRPRVGTADVAADLMCETFVRALVAVHDRERELPAVPLAWLLTIARNELIDSLRRGRVADETRRRLAMQPLGLTDRDLQAVESASADQQALAELAAVLPADQLEALLARVIDERSYGEIAADLKCSESVVRKRVSRAVARLRSARLEAT